MWYTIVLKYTISHYDTFYYYMILPTFCQALFRNFVKTSLFSIKTEMFFVYSANFKKFHMSSYAEPKN